MWNSGYHNVESKDANENLYSGVAPGTKSETTFSHNFRSEGSNYYVCTPHKGYMFGTITVVAEKNLNVCIWFFLF